MLVNLFAIVFALLIIIRLWRKMHVKFVTVQFQHNLFALRDNLRISAIRNQINADDFLFNYLDETLSRTIKQRSNITLLNLSITEYMNKDNRALDRFRHKINTQLTRNPEYQPFFNEYGRITTNFLTERHKISLLWVYSLIKTFKAVRDILSPVKEGIKNAIYINPKYTVSERYMKAC